MEDKILSIIIQGGLTSVALVSLWVNYRLVSNHMQHANDALNKLENAIIGLTTWLKSKKK